MVEKWKFFLLWRKKVKSFLLCRKQHNDGTRSSGCCRQVRPHGRQGGEDRMMHMITILIHTTKIYDTLGALLPQIQHSDWHEKYSMKTHGHYKCQFPASQDKVERECHPHQMITLIGLATTMTIFKFSSPSWLSSSSSPLVPSWSSLQQWPGQDPCRRLARSSTSSHGICWRSSPSYGRPPSGEWGWW